MPDHITHILSDGFKVQIKLNRRAKKNLILRPVAADTVAISIPPRLPLRELQKWLAENEAVLRRTLAKAPARPLSDGIPDNIWYRGTKRAVAIHDQKHIILTPSEILLPDTQTDRQKQHLRRFLHARAAEYLLPRLARHAARSGLQPAASALTSAKTFWGVCRRTTGIRLNWRLVGAPESVADYVCCHELAHLRHPDHSAAFWALTEKLFPETESAKQGLKRHGRELFALG